MRLCKISLFLAATLSLSASARADSFTYTYTGSQFTSLFNTGEAQVFSLSDHVSISVTLSAEIGDNFSGYVAGPTSFSASVLDTQGNVVELLTSLNPATDFEFYFATNSIGQVITSSSYAVVSVGNQTASSPLYEIAGGAFGDAAYYNEQYANPCAPANCSYLATELLATNTVAGTWGVVDNVSPAATPEPNGLIFAGTGLLGVAVFARRRLLKQAAPAAEAQRRLRVSQFRRGLSRHGSERLLACFAMFGMLCSPLSAKADAIQAFCGSSSGAVNAGGETADTTPAQAAAIEATLYQVSCPSTPADGGTVSSVAQGQLSTGVFGASATIGGPVAAQGFGTDLASGVFMGYYFNTPGLTSGTALFSVTVDPTLSATGRGLSFVYVEPAAGVSSPELQNGNTAFDITSSGPTTLTFSVPITDGKSGGGANIYIGLEFLASVNCYQGTGGCSATADFLDPAAFSGVTIYDANGNIVPDQTLTSQGGFTVPETLSPTPEPPSLMFLATGLIGCAASVRQRCGNRR